MNSKTVGLSIILGLWLLTLFVYAMGWDWPFFAFVSLMFEGAIIYSGMASGKDPKHGRKDK